MVTTAASVEWTTVSTEVEALQLEYSWIKEFDPRFNVRYRDDKSYPYLAVTHGGGVPPRAGHARRQAQGHPLLRPVRARLGDPGDGRPAAAGLPGAHLHARACSAAPSRSAGRACSATSTSARRRAWGGSAPAEHRAIAADLCDFMAGSTTRFVRRIEREMSRAAAGAGLRARRPAARRPRARWSGRWRRTRSCSGTRTDADVFALAEDDLEAAVQVFHVRGGRVRGQRGWVVEKVEDVTSAELVEHLLQQVYGDVAGDVAAGVGEEGPASVVPREVLVPELPPDPAGVAAWLSGLRGAAVDLRVPQRGDKRALMETVARNAGQSLALHKTRRAGDLTTRSRGPAARCRRRWASPTPRCASSATTCRTCRGPTSSRRWSSSRTAWPASRSTAASRCAAPTGRTTPRRCTRCSPGASAAYAEEQAGPVPGAVEDAGRARRFAYPPNLVVVDGGAPQVAAAARALADAGVERRRPVRPRQAAGGGVAARRGPPRRAPALQRGPVPAAAGARRGAPLRHRLPPAAPQPGDDHQRPGRRPRSRPDPADAPCCGTSAR